METNELVLIVEDESSIVDTLKFALNKEGFKTHAVSTGQAALESLNKVSPVAVVLDVGLPDISGFDVCRNIRARSSVPILFLTARAEEVDRILGLELGADDYISKPFSPRELVTRVKVILRRTQDKLAANNTQIKSKDFSIDKDKLIISFKGIALNLSRYEFRILSVLIKRPGRVYSREDLMNIAWETPEMSLERTVDTHIKTIRSKLKAVDKNNNSIITHRGFGYSLSES